VLHHLTIPLDAAVWGCGSRASRILWATAILKAVKQSNVIVLGGGAALCKYCLPS
ncbi:uncharacterized protein METZ01_LOCUS195191, partial [marine metagenome]